MTCVRFTMTCVLRGRRSSDAFCKLSCTPWRASGVHSPPEVNARPIVTPRETASMLFLLLLPLGHSECLASIA